MRPEVEPVREDNRPVAEIVQDAVEKWEALTGVSMDQSSFSLGDLGPHHMNKMLKEALELDPEGTTAYLLLEVFLRFFLEDKSFTAAQIMKDYEKTTAFLREAEGLFSVVQSERALEISAGFRSRVIEGLKRYGADRPEVLELVNGPDALPFLRRDALRSLEKLQAYQFLEGEADAAHPQAIRNVHMAWSINNMLAATRDMPVSGVGLVLMRDASHPNRSYFSFVMRNGDNVIVFTDRTKPAYPGQEDVLSGRGGRGAARTYAARENANHFPYQLIPTSYDDRGDVVFEKETAPVAEGLRLVPLMEIGELPPAQAVWVTMMLSLIADRFWHKAWRAPELSYTGAMIRRRQLLVEDDSGNRLPAAQDYRPIELEDLRVDELTGAAMAEQCACEPEGINAWLEERYRDRVPSEVINLWHRSHNEAFFLPQAQGKEDPHAGSRKVPVDIGGGIMSIKDMDKLSRYQKPKGYALSTFSEADFGTEAELNRDRLFIGRKNMAAYIQKCADEEFQARKSEVEAWYWDAVQRNIKGLLALVAAGPDEPRKLPSGYHRSLLGFGEIRDDEIFGTMSAWGWGMDNMFGEFSTYGQKYSCYLTEARATYRACLSPRDLDDLMVMTGLAKDEIPDVLQHWGGSMRHSGNHLLNRIDPMDTDVRNPWNHRNIKLEVNIYLSKRGFTRVQSGKY